MEYSNLFVVLMGLGTVFFGLICIILLTYAMGAVLRPKNGGTPSAPGKTAAPTPLSGGNAAPAARIAPAAPAPIQPAMVAAVSAALAETLGTSVSGIRIASIRRLDAPAASAEGSPSMIAAVSAALAETLGTSVNGIRITSIKRV